MLFGVAMSERRSWIGRAVGVWNGLSWAWIAVD